MPETIADLKTEFTDLDKQLTTMLDGKDIYKDAWSPEFLKVDGVDDAADKMDAYIAKAQERKAVEDKLKQAEAARNIAASSVKSAPSDSEWSFKDPNNYVTGGIKSMDELRNAVKAMTDGYNEGQKTTELKFHPDFLKAIVVAGTTQARHVGQEVMIPAYPTIDIITLAEWFEIESNIYTRYEMARGSDAGTRNEASAVVDLNPTAPQRSFVLRSVAGYVSIARESLEDLGQLQMAVQELIDRELRKKMASQAALGNNTGSEWNGIQYQITKTAAIAASTAILGSLRAYIIAAVANGYPFTHFLGDAATIGKIVKAQDDLGFSQYDRERYPFGHFLGCIPVPTTQLSTNNALLITQKNLKLVHKGGIEIMMSEDSHFLNNAIVLRGLFRGNVVYTYPTTEGQEITATNNYTAA